ncbi:LysR family transcriptional regulator [Anaerotruncus colihominis]|uniref:LysR family transcriptional regulator n=1 Tax=Anaerotruncus colihominis TaxID=169435 RepID=UPI00189BEDE1|nr:LysR family transcriptional regulator [Anaerotruncus colihominis]
MDLKQLEFFTVACERGSLSSAAACMYTSQPNVSRNIRALEHELGRTLLTRNGKGVQPTVFGKTVLEYAKMILKTTATISSLAVPDEQNSLRLSTYPSNMIARLLTEFYENWGSSYHIEHHEGAVEEVTEHVHQGISEIGIVYVAQKQVPIFQHILFHKKLEFVPLDVKKICVYVGPKHPLYHVDSVDFADLPSLKFMGGVRDFFSMEHHLETVSVGVIDTRSLKYVVYTNSDHLTINLLLHTDICSLGLNFMYTPYEQYDIKPLEINGCEPFLQIGYIRDPERALSAQACWLTERFRKML